MWIETYEGMAATAKEAGLQHLGYKNNWLIIWKPGTTEGWITKTGRGKDCYCHDCTDWRSRMMLCEIVANVGLTTVSVGDCDTSDRRHLAAELALNRVHPRENVAFQAFESLHAPKEKREKEITKIRRLLPNAQEELARRRSEIEKLTREVDLLEEELKKSASET